MSEHRFLPRDRVRVRSTKTRYQGSVGSVVEVAGNSNYRVKLDGFHYPLGFTDYELEPEPEPDQHAEVVGENE